MILRLVSYIRIESIHGGVPGVNGQLRPTNGCLRLSDADMVSLVAAILLVGQAPDQCQAIVLNATNAGTQPVAATGDDGDGDPPPTAPLKPLP
jgi:hypothetical protein